MLGHRCSPVEHHGLFVSAVVRIKRRRFPASWRLLFLPPPCDPHQNNRLRSHPLHFASTAPLPPPHPSRSKCRGICLLSVMRELSTRMQVECPLSAPSFG